MLELHGLTRRYGEVVALDDVSFTVGERQMFGFVGPNGAGKTTAMRIVLGVLRPDAGQVRWRSRPMDDAARRRTGYMPEERGLYPKMRLRDPGGTIAKVASFLPPVAPLTMPVRVAGGEAAGWEIVVSVLLTLASIALLVPLSARLYAGAVLRTGARVKLRAAWTASRG